MTTEWEYLLLIAHLSLVFLNGWGLIRGEREGVGLVRRRPIYKIKS